MPSAHVALLGLGPMGVALAVALLAAGRHVTVWNRSAKDLSDLGLDTATLADDPATAVEDADVVVLCVRDHDASAGLVSAIASGLRAGTPVVNLTTATPNEATASADMASKRRIRYLTGAIMVPTPLIGTDQNLVLYAGEADDFAAARDVLGDFGGTVDYLGKNHALPPALDLAMLDVYFAGMYAFLHSAALASAHGIDAATYLPYAEAIVGSLAGTLPGLATAITERSYESGEARLDMCLAFLDKIVAASRAARIDDALPEVIRDASRRAAGRWPAETDWDVVAEGLLPDRTLAGR